MLAETLQEFLEKKSWTGIHTEEIPEGNIGRILAEIILGIPARIVFLCPEKINFD